MYTRARFWGLIMAGLLATVAGCGGGGGGGGGTATDTQSPPPPPLPPPADKYEASSYSSDATSNQSLTGLWMMVEESHTKQLAMPGFGQPGDYREVKRKRRNTVNIIDHGNGTATTYNCVDTSAEVKTVSTAGSVIQFPVDGAILQATIVNNQRMEGGLITDSTPGNLVTVLASQATLIKIADQPTLPDRSPTGLGKVSARITENNTVFLELTDQKIYCFTQEKYETERLNRGVLSKTAGSSIEFISLSKTPSTTPLIDGYLDVEIFYGSETDSNGEVALNVATDTHTAFLDSEDPVINLTSDSVEAVRGNASFTHQGSYPVPGKIEIQFEIGL